MKRTVLIVDDNDLARAMLRDALKGIDCSVTEVSDGNQALAALQASEPAVLLLDLVMPGKSGLEVLRLIKDKALATRVLVVSSMDSPAMSERLDVEGAHGFISKPFHPLDVQTAVTAAFEAYAEATHG